MQPGIIDTLLPSILPRLLAAASPTPSSQHSIASELSHAAPPPQLTALGISLHDRLANTLESGISALYAYTLSHANWLRSIADNKFADMLEEDRLALERVAEKQFNEFKERCERTEEDVVERVGWRTEEMYEDVTKRVGPDKGEIQRLKEDLKKEIPELRKDTEELRIDKDEIRKEREDL
ncbi:hypothetical protein SVAN01_08155 [Stagonosporopsis vannaccii]|nr:hypothetical protein SVAN01_08155 [Stagonosporopsis vannaccii]